MRYAIVKGKYMSTNVGNQNLSEPIIRKKILTAKNDASCKTVINFGEFGQGILDEPKEHGGSGMGPSPLHGLLGTLCGCESVTFHRAAKEMNFNYNSLEFSAEFTIDIRGRMGVRSVVPHFKTVRMEVLVDTNETESKLSEVVIETEARCPVYNLINDAGVKIETQWLIKAKK